MNKKAWCVSMTAEQQTGYTIQCAKNILHYRNLLFVIIAVQIYNIAYALFYTKGRLHTTASRVYVVLYLSLLLVTTVGLLMFRRFQKVSAENARIVMRFQVFYGTFLLFWSACITAYDQRVSDSISVYLIMALGVAAFIHFTTVQTVAIYGICGLMLFYVLPVFRDQSRSDYGERVNLAVMTLVCICICLYRNYGGRKDYLYHQIILEKNAYLHDLSEKDTLTGLKNRRFLEEELDSLYEKCIEEKATLSFMMLDIDAFKAYNDTFGHQQGDECLRRVAWRLHKELDDEHEYLIRYGGDEFLYIGIGVDEETAKSKARHFNSIIRKLVIGPSDQDAMGVTVSIGLYTLAGDDTAKPTKSADCIREADKALYMAKNAGKDTTRNI